MSASTTIVQPEEPKRAADVQQSPAAQIRPRNIAVDAYRGLVMLLMMAEVLHLSVIQRSFPGLMVWKILAYNQTHVEWAGLGLHDMIQPSFTFLVGVAIPYSVYSRIQKGQSFGKMLTHTLWRSFVLVALGVLLRSLYSPQTNFTFEDTLSQIGMGYTFAFLLSFCLPRWQWVAFWTILFGYWLAWAIYPAPGPGFDYAAVGVPANWQHNFTGFASHWNKNSNLGQAFDVWFLNLFPRPSRFLFNSGGYLTLSFIPTLATMLLGLLSGEWLRSCFPAVPIKRFVQTGLLLVTVGALLHFTGICPIVKRIWTPSWTLFSGGLCLLLLALFCWVVEVKRHKQFVFPLVVVGTNSIAAYLMAHLWEDFLIRNLHTNLGYKVFQIFGVALEPLLMGTMVLLVYWVALYWMYKNKIFLRI